MEAFEAARGTGHNETRRALRAVTPPGSPILIQTLSFISGPFFSLHFTGIAGFWDGDVVGFFLLFSWHPGNVL